MEIGIDERRVAIEAIATLANLKNMMVERILRPAGVPSEIYQPLLNRRDEVTGRHLSKRKIAPLIIDALDRRPDGSRIVRCIIEIAAKWNSYHLADDEYLARATVQKAREVLGTLEFMEAKEAEQHKGARTAELAQTERERAVLREQSQSLLLAFDEFVNLTDHQRRGYLLQGLLTQMFDLHNIPIFHSFTRSRGGEQIDGAFQLNGWYYIVECRWRERLADIRQLDGLLGQVNRSGRQTMGVYLSINGWSEHVVPLLKQNPEKSIILIDGFDLRAVLDVRLDLRQFLMAKIAKLNLESEPFLGATQYLLDRETY